MAEGAATLRARLPFARGRGGALLAGYHPRGGLDGRGGRPADPDLRFGRAGDVRWGGLLLGRTPRHGLATAFKRQTLRLTIGI
jgi:hypothetical protein